LSNRNNKSSAVAFGVKILKKIDVLGWKQKLSKDKSMAQVKSVQGFDEMPRMRVTLMEKNDIEKFEISIIL
jgi:hypothetical protein